VRIAVFGLGIVGSHLIRQLSTHDDDCSFEITVVSRRSEPRQISGVSLSPWQRVQWAYPGAVPECDIGVIALPAGHHYAIAQRLIRRGADVVSVSDAVEDVQALKRLDAEAQQRGRRIAAGAGFAPGLTCVLARHAAATFDAVTEVHVAKQGTGGPSCARQHHASLKLPAWDYRDGEWLRRPGGSGRELLWFPSPVDGVDCYRAELPDALLLQPAFPSAHRISARLGATRRDRFTSRLPMLRPPHAEGGVGAVRVEVWGTRSAQPAAQVLGVAARPAEAAAVVVQETLRVLSDDASWSGVRGLAQFVHPGLFLRRARVAGLTVETFEGHRDWQ